MTLTSMFEPEALLCDIRTPCTAFRGAKRALRPS